MKGKLFILAIAVAVVSCVLAMPEASADYDDYRYVVVDNMEYSVNMADSTASLISVLYIDGPDLEIPPYIEFDHDDNPDTDPFKANVTSVEMGAVYLEGITSVKIGKNLTTIEEDAFSGPDIEQFIDSGDPGSPFFVDDGVLFRIDVSTDLVRYPAAKAGDSYEVDAMVNSLYGGAFRGCTKLKSINFADNSLITEIPAVTFMGCTNLEKINYDATDEYNHLPEKLVLIENSAFSGCSSLGNIKFPNDLRLIESEAFMGCGAEKYFLNWNLTYLGTMAFADCPNLKLFESFSNAIFTGNGQFEIGDDGVLYEIIGNVKTLLCYPAGKDDTSYTISDDTNRLAWGAFYGSRHLKEVTIGSKVNLIEVSAFQKCPSLTTVNLTKNVSVIMMSAFEGCTSLTTINNMEGLTEIGSAAFRCVNITELTLPESIRNIGYFAFDESKLTKITIPDAAVTICTNAFLSCWDLKDIYFEGDRMEFEEGALNVGTDEENTAEYTVHIIRTASIPSVAVDNEYTKLTIDKEGEHPYPYENFIGVAICLFALFGIVMVIREV